jgi:CRP-like cAMP-binding protein
LKAGETLLAAGEKNNHLYLVMAGSLKAELEGARTMNFAAGQCIGEISALGESTMSAPVVAAEESLVLAIAPDTLWAMIAADAMVARNILAMLAHR